MVALQPSLWLVVKIIAERDVVLILLENLFTEPFCFQRFSGFYTCISFAIDSKPEPRCFTCLLIVFGLKLLTTAMNTHILHIAG